MQADDRRSRQGRLVVMAALAAILVTVGVLAGACGNGGGGENQTPSPEGTTIAPVPPVDPNVNLVEFHSSDKGYSLRYPEGWEVLADPGAVIDAFRWVVGDRRLALLQVTCNRELKDPDSLMRADQSLASTFGGSLDATAAVPVEVAGAEGLQVTYNTSVGGLPVEHVVAYVAHGDCGWRISISSYPPGSLQPYLPLFDRILASVRFD